MRIYMWNYRWKTYQLDICQIFYTNSSPRERSSVYNNERSFAFDPNVNVGQRRKIMVEARLIALSSFFVCVLRSLIARKHTKLITGFVMSRQDEPLHQFGPALKGKSSLPMKPWLSIGITKSPKEKSAASSKLCFPTIHSDNTHMYNNERIYHPSLASICCLSIPSVEQQIWDM